VYPLSRGLPVVLVAVSDLVLGQSPNAVGWVGIGLVTVGCVLLPLNSFRDFNLARYKNKALFFTLLTAAGTVGYSIIDSAAAKQMPTGVESAVRYELWEMLLTWVFYQVFVLVFRATPQNQTKAPWRQVWVVGILLFGTYGLVLWAYQLSDHPSYVVALRQISIVLGVVAGTFFLKESARRVKLVAAVTIILGGIGIALAK
jgi:drug/metabolite transporter (DMT)-like permease